MEESSTNDLVIGGETMGEISMINDEEKSETVSHDVPGIEIEKDEQVSAIECAASKNPTAYNKPPVYLSVERWQQWKDKWKWLFSKNEKLGCTTCRDVNRLVDTGRGIKISAEWSEGSVSVCKNAPKPVKKMRDKIYQHVDSATHKTAENVLKERKVDKLGNLIVESSSAFDLKTEANFRTAYTIAKERMSLKKMEALTSLQHQNGLKMGSVHHSDHACANILDHIGTEMRETMISHIKKNQSVISVAIDETTMYNKSYMILYLRADVGEGVVENIFLDIVECTEGTTADALYKTLRTTLNSHKLDEHYLNDHLISITTDGASVMTGRENGVVTQMKRDFPRVKSIHCVAHRLELSVKDSLKAVNSTNHFESFITKLYTLYHQSYKNQRELEEAASGVQETLRKITPIFSIRWVASSFRAVKAVWHDFAALSQHFQTASEDQSRNGKDRSKYVGLKRHMETTGFVTDLANMKDVLRELSTLSLDMQRRDMSVPEAYAAVDNKVAYLEALCNLDKPGKSLKKAMEQIESNKSFKNVPLTESVPKIKRTQFFQAVVDNLKARFPDDGLVEMLKPLEPSNWPEDEDHKILYGDQEMFKLAKLLSLPVNKTVDEFRAWKKSAKAQGETLKRVLCAAKIYNCSSAECERGFSAANNTVTPMRNKLRAKTLASLLFIDLNGPPAVNFKPQKYVRSWIMKGHNLSGAVKPGPKPLPLKPRPLWSVWD